MPKTDSRTKRIFVSDIHMGDAESLHPSGGLHPWCWLYADHAKMFADFLELKLHDSEVREIVILGDLLDEWVCPTEVDPVPPGSSSGEQFQKIAEAPQNVAAINNLKAIAASDEIDLIYVPGNHDMLMTRDVLTEIIPGITYLGTGAGEGVFTADGIAAEHGSMYTLFNAPDTYSRPGHSLPIGFFIARSVAENTAKGDGSLHYLEILAETIVKLLGKEDFVRALFTSIVNAAGVSSEAPIKMAGLDGYSGSVTVREAGTWFGDLYEQWKHHMPNNVTNAEAVLDDVMHLYTAAITQYFRKKHKADIVIFGHTHVYALHALNFDVDFEKTTHEEMQIGYKHIYANSGTWCNRKKHCTFVETEVDENAGKHHVRLKEYTPDGSIVTLGERFKPL